MASGLAYNLKNPAVKRILQEIKEVQADTSGDFIAEALENDIFEWHFIIRGPADSEFEGGVYHGRILLPAEYPFKPPAFMMLTPSGRFETGMKICLSISAHHPEHWQPSWSVRTALTALVAFMPSPGAGALGSLDYTKEERKKLALKSRQEPPKWGNPDRQRLIEEMHARMLAIAPLASSSSVPQPTSPRAADATTPASESQAAPPAQSPPPASNSPTHSPKQSTAPTVAEGPDSVPHAGQGTASAPSAPTAPAPLSPPPPPQLITQDSGAHTPTPALVTPANPAPCLTHAPSCLKHREPAGHASVPTTPTVSRHIPTTTRATSPTRPRAAAPAPAAPPPDTWALSALAVALGVLIAAILLRKALVAVGYDLPPLTGTGAFTDGH